MHQIIHLSLVGCFTPARGKTVQKNREVSGVKQNCYQYKCLNFIKSTFMIFYFFLNRILTIYKITERAI